jgi:hypothetical protein
MLIINNSQGLTTKTWRGEAATETECSCPRLQQRTAGGRLGNNPAHSGLRMLLRPGTGALRPILRSLRGIWGIVAKARKIEPQSSDYLDEIRQFLPGIEVYPFAGRICIGQTPVSFALNPYQFLVNWNQTAGLVIFPV